jgi:membrane protein required for beta-lactamase induction
MFGRGPHMSSGLVVGGTNVARSLPALVFWVAVVMVAIGTIVERSGHHEVAWTVVQDCGVAAAFLAAAAEAHRRWRRRSRHP